MILGLALAFAQTASGQERLGTIVGTITDRESHAGVDGGVVLLQGTLLRARSDERGFFRLSGVPPGRHTLTVLAIGYASDSLADVTVVGTDTVSVAFDLSRAPVDLADIVVTASRAPERSTESGASVALLPAQELTRRNITTLDQALQFAPGVTFNAGQMDIRGSTGLARGVGSRVLLMLDGHPILSGDGGEVDFESLPLLDVNRVEVVKGAYSSLYGGSALSGVVNVITSPIDSGSSTTVRAHYGVWQLPDRFRYTSDQLAERGIGLQHSTDLDGIGVRLFLGRETSDGYRQDDQKARWLGRVKMSSAPGSAHPWDAYAVWARERDGEFFLWRSDSQPFQVDPPTINDYEIDYKLLTGATLTPVARAHTLLRLSPYVNYNSVQNRFASGANHDNHRATRVGTQLDWSLALGPRHTVDVGGDVAHTIVTSNFLGAHDINDDALFMQDQWRPLSGWSASLGARLDYHRATGGRAEWSTSPKVALAYQATPWLSMRASAGHGFRSPSAIEQFVNTTQFGYPVIPNPQLRSERAWSQEFGLTATPGRRLRLDGTVFQSQYRDLIGPALASDSFGQFVAQFRNLTRARVRGADVSLKSTLVDGLLSVQANYLFLKTRDDSSGLPLPYRSRHNLTGTIAALGGLLDVDLRYRSRVEQVLQYFTDPRGHITVVDLRMAYQIGGIALQAKVSNLFQAFYVDVQERNPGAPRQLSLTAYRRF
jgi:outer membrane receptor for ferrienterochelin and colicins